MSQELQDNQEALYRVYLERLNEGDYVIPPCLIIGEIVSNRYLPENLDIIDEGLPISVVVNSVEDLRSKEVFLSILRYQGTVDEDILNSNLRHPNTIYNWLRQYISTRTIMIKYPETTITNSEGRTHNIKDLFIKIKFNADGGISNNFTMGRSTYTLAELMVGYKHSHHRAICISEDNLKSFQTTCLGSGVLANTMSYMRGVHLNEFDEVRIMGMFADIDAYVGWESLEGVPHIRMSSIVGMDRNSNRARSVNYGYSPSLTQEINLIKILIADPKLMSFCKMIPSIKDNFPYYKIQIDEYNLAQYVTSIAKQNNLYDLIEVRNHVCIISQDEFGNVEYFNIGGTSDRLTNIRRYNNTSLFTFKGEDVKLKVLDIDTQQEELNVERIVQPEIMYYIIGRIESEINKKNGRNKFQQSDY